MQTEKVEVLLIEDDLGEAEVIRDMLAGATEAGFAVQHVQYLAHGVQLIRERSFDLVLADLGLPDSGGLATALALRRETKVTPIVILTVLNDEHAAIGALQMDIQDYLIKDEISSRVLIRSIRYAIARKKDSLERERAEEALRSIMAQLKMITDIMPVGVAQCSRDHRYLWCSPEYARWLNRAPEEVAGHAIAEVIGTEALDTIHSYIDYVLNGNPLVYEAQVTYRGMGRRWISARCMPTLDGAGVPDGWVEVLFDFTKRREMEEELRRSREHLQQRVTVGDAALSSTVNKLHAETLQRLQAVEDATMKEQMLIQQSRLAALGEMIGYIAHQWRQPLNILGLIMQELPLYLESGALTGEYLRESVSRGMDLIGHMSRTINDFQDFFKPEKEKVEFSVKAVVEQAISLVSGSFSHENIALEVIAEEDISVESYRNEYTQVIVNILMNARDVFRERKVPHPTVVIRIFKDGGRAVTTVADNAGGIPESILGTLFDPYVTTKAQEQGTGLGLHMAKTIIEKNMGGQLSARNTDKGAEFRIVV